MCAECEHMCVNEEEAMSECGCLCVRVMSVSECVCLCKLEELSKGGCTEMMLEVPGNKPRNARSEGEQQVTRAEMERALAPGKRSPREEAETGVHAGVEARSQPQSMKPKTCAHKSPQQVFEESNESKQHASVSRIQRTSTCVGRLWVSFVPR